MAKTQAVGMLTITALSTDDVVVTGLGFKPTGIMLQLANENGGSINSRGVASSVENQGCIQSNNQELPFLETSDGERLFYIRDGDGGWVSGSLKSFDDDGFTLLIVQNLSADNSGGIYYAFKSE